jgi:hypothetical protein
VSHARAAGRGDAPCAPGYRSTVHLTSRSFLSASPEPIESSPRTGRFHSTPSRENPAAMKPAQPQPQSDSGSVTCTPTRKRKQPRSEASSDRGFSSG